MGFHFANKERELVGLNADSNDDFNSDFNGNRLDNCFFFFRELFFSQETPYVSIYNVDLSAEVGL